MRRPEADRRDFASDNCAGAHPDVLAALAGAGRGHQPSYGDDDYTTQLRHVVRDEFGPQAQVFPVFNGTGANIVALQAMARRWEAVICSTAAHLHTDETAAPELHGMKLLPVASPDGRIDPGALEPVVRSGANPHHPQPGVLTVSQTTELGTCFTREHLRELTLEAHRLGLTVHIDGARIANAAATLGCSLRELTTDAGVDVISWGATKNGGVFGDLVLVLDPEAAPGTPYLQKATTQLPSKTRFVSAQVLALLEDGLWRRNAQASNAMAARLRDGLAGLPGVRIVHPVESNAVFAQLPDPVSERLREDYSFSTWDADSGVVRLMTAFDTEDSDVDGFVAAARSAVTETAVRA